jgi:hypothetical protein
MGGGCNSIGSIMIYLCSDEPLLFLAQAIGVWLAMIEEI